MSENVSSEPHPPLSGSPPTSLLEPQMSNTPITSRGHLVALTGDESSLQAVSFPSLFRSTWKPSCFARRSSPLTPIMASPSSSPAASMSHEVVLDTEDGKEENPAHNEFAAYAEIATSNPTWMSTPPTPLPKYVHQPSVSVNSPLRSSFVTASASFPNTALSSVPKAPYELTKRPSSFPAMSVAKPFPAILPVPPSPSIRRRTRSSRGLLRVSDGECGGERPCLSRKPSLQGVKLSFHMPYDDSDKDDDDEVEGLTGYSKDSLRGEESSLEAPNNPTRAKDDLALDDARKCHALFELLSTEVGYLLDLKILVNVRPGWLDRERLILLCIFSGVS